MTGPEGTRLGKLLMGLKPSGPAPRSGLVLLASATLAACLVLTLRLLAGPLRGGAAAGGAAAIGRRGLAAPANDLAAARRLLSAWPEGKPKACILILARNSDIHGVLSSVGQLERRFNAAPEARYPYIYLNDEPFSLGFRAAASAAAAGASLFGVVPREHWSYPPHINTTRAAELREEARHRMPYGGSESYRFMCRYFSGFFFDHPLLKGFDWYWRVEPEVFFFCNLPAPAADPFRHMQRNNQSLAWTIVMDEVPSTIPSLWPAVQQWMAQQPQHVAPGNLLPAFTRGGPQQGRLRIDGGDDGGERHKGVAALKRRQPGAYDAATYTGCHFWSNFEIGRLSFFRSAAYRSFFQHLDAGTGFFYERWGDAPVHTLAAAALLRPDQVYFARDIGYRHGSWSYCPSEPADRQRCDCHPGWDYHVLAQPQCQLDYLTRLAAMQVAEE